jgi:hypothetical protein
MGLSRNHLKGVLEPLNTRQPMVVRLNSIHTYMS